MKIVVNGRFLTQPITGVQQYALKLSIYLKEHLGKEVEFVSPHGILHSNLAEKLGVKIVGNTRGFFWEQVELPFWLKKEGSPLLINFGNVAPQYYSNQIVTIHDLSTLEHPEWYSNKFARAYKFVIPQVVQNARKVIAVSNFTKHRLMELLMVESDKIEVIYNSIDTIHSLSSTNPEPYFLSVGSFSGRKNFTTLIRAFNKAAIKGYTLKMRGDQEDIFKGEAELDELAGIKGSVHFIEPLNYDAYLELIKNATALINTSVYEGFGMPNLEALSLGVPVICSDIEVFKEVCGPCASYVDPLDENMLTQLMIDKVKKGSSETEKKDRIKQAHLFKMETEGKKMTDLITQLLQKQ